MDVDEKREPRAWVREGGRTAFTRCVVADRLYEFSLTCSPGGAVLPLEGRLQRLLQRWATHKKVTCRVSTPSYPHSLGRLGQMMECVCGHAGLRYVSTFFCVWGRVSIVFRVFIESPPGHHAHQTTSSVKCNGGVENCPNTLQPLPHTGCEGRSPWNVNERWRGQTGPRDSGGSSFLSGTQSSAFYIFVSLEQHSVHPIAGVLPPGAGHLCLAERQPPAHGAAVHRLSTMLTGPGRLNVRADHTRLERHCFSDGGISNFSTTGTETVTVCCCCALTAA